MGRGDVKKTRDANPELLQIASPNQCRGSILPSPSVFHLTFRCHLVSSCSPFFFVYGIYVYLFCVCVCVIHTYTWIRFARIRKKDVKECLWTFFFFKGKNVSLPIRLVYMSRQKHTHVDCQWKKLFPVRNCLRQENEVGENDHQLALSRLLSPSSYSNRGKSVVKVYSALWQYIYSCARIKRVYIYSTARL